MSNGTTTSASWTQMLYMRRVYANGQIEPRIIYSWPWMGIIYSWPQMGSTLVPSFCCCTISIYPTFVHYMCINSFHQILLSIEIDRARVVVFDSLRKPKEKYQDLIDIMQKAWAHFIKKRTGVTSTPCDLYFKLDFPVRIHIEHLLLFL